MITKCLKCGNELCEKVGDRTELDNIKKFCCWCFLGLDFQKENYPNYSEKDFCCFCKCIDKKDHIKMRIKKELS